MNPPAMPTLLELLTPPIQVLKMPVVRSPICKCGINPRSVTAKGTLDAYCSGCRKARSKKYYKKRDNA
jgi:hypothetical protein